MRAELPVLSFFCLVILIITLPLNIKRKSIPNLVLSGWLLTCNLIHAINSVVWAHNVIIQIPVWCDIVTKLLLASNIALPVAYICHFRELENISSNRESHNNRYKGKLLQALLCIPLPIIYICLHFIVQDRRFDIVQDFGCQAAIHPSTLSLILIWAPALIACGTALVYLGCTVSNYSDHRHKFSRHLATRETSLNVPHFILQMISSTIQTIFIAFLFIYSLFAQASSSVFDLSAPWLALHSRFSQIGTTSIGTAPTSYEGVRIVVTWWTIPVLSIIHVLFSVFGEVVQQPERFGLGWINKRLFGDDVDHDVGLPARSRMLGTGDIPPIHHLPSFWDDSSDAKLRRNSQKALPKRKRSRELLSTSQSSGSPPNSPSAGDHEADKSFKESTMSYVQSPIGQKAVAAGQIPPSPRSPDSKYSSSAATATSSILRIPPGQISLASSINSAQSHGRPDLPPTPSSTATTITITGPSGKRPPESPLKPILKHVKRASSNGSTMKDTGSHEGAYGLRQEDVIYMTVVSKIAP